MTGLPVWIFRAPFFWIRRSKSRREERCGAVCWSVWPVRLCFRIFWGCSHIKIPSNPDPSTTTPQCCSFPHFPQTSSWFLPLLPSPVYFSPIFLSLPFLLRLSLNISPNNSKTLILQSITNKISKLECLLNITGSNRSSLLEIYIRNL